MRGHSVTLYLRGKEEKKIAYVVPKSTDEIQDKLVQWLNDNLIDPYEQSTDKGRPSFVFGDDFKLCPIYPKIHVSVADIGRAKITAGKKTTYLEEIEHMFLIYYHNQLAHRFVFNDGTKLSNEKQCRKYLMYIQIKLKAHLDDFGIYFNKTVFGTIPRPVFNTKTSTWVSMLPMTVFTYQR